MDKERVSSTFTQPNRSNGTRYKRTNTRRLLHIWIKTTQGDQFDWGKARGITQHWTTTDKARRSTFDSLTRSRSGEVLITLTWRREALISSVDPTGRWNTRISRPRAKYLSLVDAISRKRSHRRATWLKCENLITFSELESYLLIIGPLPSSMFLGPLPSSVFLGPLPSSMFGYPLGHPHPWVILRPWWSLLILGPWSSSVLGHPSCRSWWLRWSTNHRNIHLVDGNQTKTISSRRQLLFSSPLWSTRERVLKNKSHSCTQSWAELPNSAFIVR